MVQNVLHVVESSAPEAGTVAVLLGGLHDALRERDMESDVISLNGSTDAESGRLGTDPPPSPNEKDHARLVADADLLHFHGWGHEAARRLAVEARRAGKPYVISPLGLLTYGPHRRRTWGERLAGPFRDGRVVRRAAALTASSNKEADDLEACRVHANVHRLPYGITSVAYESNGDVRSASIAKTNVRGMLMLGPLEPVEGFVSLLRSLEELGAFTDGWNLVVAGRDIGDWSAALGPRIAKNGWTGRIRFCDAPDVATQRELLAQASLLVVPNLHTRCPVSILQAAAVGVPVIASAFTVPSILEDTVCVFGTARVEMKIDLRRMLGLSDEERSVMAERAREVVRNRVDWCVVVDEYVQLYRGLV